MKRENYVTLSIRFGYIRLIDSLRLNVLSATYIYCRHCGRYFFYHEERQTYQYAVNWTEFEYFPPSVYRKYYDSGTILVIFEYESITIALSAVIEEDSRVNNKKKPLRLVFSPIYPCLEMKFRKFIKCSQDLSF